jgi:hypothetical protein
VEVHGLDLVHAVVQILLVKEHVLRRYCAAEHKPPGEASCKAMPLRMVSEAHLTLTKSASIHLYTAFVGCVMNTRPLKFVCVHHTKTVEKYGKTVHMSRSFAIIPFPGSAATQRCGQDGSCSKEYKCVQR